MARCWNGDVRKADATQARLAPVIQSILDKVVRWEKVPDKRKSFTPAMWSQMNSDHMHTDMHWAHLSATGSATAILEAFAFLNGHSRIPTRTSLVPLS